MKYCCENCGWSEIIGSPIMCNYSERRTLRDECCEAWKPKEETDEKNMVNIVRCDDCGYSFCEGFVRERLYCEKHPELGEIKGDWFCADCWKA